MISIFTALYCEAEPIIQYFGLKRQGDINGFQLFSNDLINLLITGTGSINAAIGVTSLCSSSLHTPDFGDIALNIGICGTENPSLKKGTLLLGNKIIDLSTSKAYYPDMIFEHNFIEGTILTSPVLALQNYIHKDSAENIMQECIASGQQSCVRLGDVVNFSNKPLSTATDLSVTGLADTYLSVTDMESSGIFHAAKLFYQPHQMFFLKIVSDYQDEERLSKERVSSLISGNIAHIANWILPIHDELQTNKPIIFSHQEQDILKKTAEELKLTVSMQFQLNGLMHYYKIKYGDFVNDLELFLKENLKQACRSKNEGKKYFEKLRKSFL